MLTLNDVSIYLQNGGTVLAIYLVGSSKQAIEERYYSFYNHGVTGGELAWLNDNNAPYTAFFWVYEKKGVEVFDWFRFGLARAALAELLAPSNPHNFKGQDPWPIACEMALDRYDKIQHVNWLDFRVESDFGMGFAMGDAVSAEKGTGNFDDDVLGRAVTDGKAALDMVKARRQEGEEEVEPEDKEEEEVESLTP